MGITAHILTMNIKRVESDTDHFPHLLLAVQVSVCIGTGLYNLCVTRGSNQRFWVVGRTQI